MKGAGLPKGEFPPLASESGVVLNPDCQIRQHSTDVRRQKSGC